MRLQDLVLFVACLAPSVIADVQFTSPAAGASLAAGSITVEWEDSGTAPALSDLSTYTLQLYVGGNKPGTDAGALKTFTTSGKFSAGNSIVVTIDPSLAGTVANGYYLSMISVATDGGTVTNFSPRFSLTGMTGTTGTTYLTAAQAITGTDGPDTVNNVNNNAGAAAGGAATAAAGVYGVPYALQTGLTKYAPMQSVPPTKISAQSFTPLYPTSAHTIATTWLAHPTILTTLTNSQTFSVSSKANTAAAQSQPTGDMAKFLARWKD